MKERIDNLTNVFRKKHVLKVPDKPDRYITTSMTNYRFENGTYSHFLINLSLDLYSIAYHLMKMSEIIELYYRNKTGQTECILHK